MRTLATAGMAFMAAALLAPSASFGQRNSRRSSHPAPASPASPRSTAQQANSSRQQCSDDCGEYSLAVVSAVLPTDATGDADYVTVVIENRGTAVAPASVVSVAPKNRLSLARHSAIRSLAPGERTTVQLPVVIGDDGTPCISITINTAPVPAAPDGRFLAVAPASAGTDLPTAIQWAGVDDWAFMAPTSEPGAATDRGVAVLS
ncbi:MAG: hypothetical protein M3R65_00870 [Gemmatimonadota bacterium]|nr:hypothetical protein [Gemmatimonadota bacterium]